MAEAIRLHLRQQEEADASTTIGRVEGSTEERPSEPPGSSDGVRYGIIPLAALWPSIFGSTNEQQPTATIPAREPEVAAQAPNEDIGVDRAVEFEEGEWDMPDVPDDDEIYVWRDSFSRPHRSATDLASARMENARTRNKGCCTSVPGVNWIIKNVPVGIYWPSWLFSVSVLVFVVIDALSLVTGRLLVSIVGSYLLVSPGVCLRQSGVHLSPFLSRLTLFHAATLPIVATWGNRVWHSLMVSPIALFLTLSCSAYERWQKYKDDRKRTKALASIAKTERFRGQVGTTCAICLCEMRQGCSVRKICSQGHVFHTECIDQWLGVRLTCPLCVEHV